MRVSNNTLPIKDISSLLTDVQQNIIYREYKKEGDIFIANNDFYVSNINEHKKVSYRNINSKTNLIQEIQDNVFEYNGDRVYTDMNSYIDKRIINLLVINDIEFNIDETNINKQELFKKYIENEKQINDLLLEDIYFNEDFSNKINISLPISYKNIDDTIEKKYLFKINLNELQRSHFVENNI